MESNKDHHHHVAKIDSLLRQVQIRTLQGLPQPIEIINLTNHERTGQLNHLDGRMVQMTNIEIETIDVQNLVKGQDSIGQEQIDLLAEGSMDQTLELKDQDLMDSGRLVELVHQGQDDLMVHHDRMVQDLVVLEDSTALEDLMVHSGSMVRPNSMARLDSMVHQDSMVHLDLMVHRDKMVQEISIHVIIALLVVEVLVKEVVLHTQCEAVSHLGQCVKNGLVLVGHPLVVGLAVDGVVVVVDDFNFKTS